MFTILRVTTVGPPIRSQIFFSLVTQFMDPYIPRTYVAGGVE